MSVENIKSIAEFEHNFQIETERKFIPVFPEAVERFRAESRPIEQFYLSHPDEPYSLRFRETLDDTGALQYEATLKDRGTVACDGIHRLEVTAPVDASLYQYYQTEQTPTIRKLRAEPRPGVTVDFYEDGSVQVESESQVEWQTFLGETDDCFVEVTGDRTSTNEWKAHLSFRRANEGREALVQPHELQADDIVNDTIHNTATPRVVHIGGRSGSGKSTIVREVREKLERVGMSSVVISTDDYHRGMTWLREFNGGETWTHWDDPIVYDTKTMAVDLTHLANGTPIYRREIDWTIAEPVISGTIQPVDVIIVEGIYAKSPDIMQKDSLSYEMTTPLATCIGRRLLRDMRERPQFADSAESLSYMLHEAEPCYRSQETERRTA